MTQRFEKAYNALLNAFMNDTLAAGTCAACAVGNIIADAMGGKISVDKKGMYLCSENNLWWGNMFLTIDNTQIVWTIKQRPVLKVYRKRIFDLTGYKWKEVAKIEKAFEKNTKIKSQYYSDYKEHEIMEDQFNGLMAVMDVLIKLDEVAEGQKYKDQFKAKLQTV